MTTDPRKNWRNALVQPDATLQEAIRALNDAGLQIALVIGPGDLLVGTITDGDIRRGLLRGIDLHSPIESVIHRTPIVVPPGMDRQTVAHIMHANRVHQLPVVDAQGRLVDVHVRDHLEAPEERPNVVVVMAGGEGTRLRPHTQACPKPLLPVAGKPMLQHIVERARADGFRRFVFAINYLGHMIEEHFGDGSAWNVRIDYLREQSPLGTAGALALLDPSPEHPFVVTNGDVLTQVQYGAVLDFHIRQGALATMAVRQQELQSSFGVVHTSGIDIVGFEEKPVFRHLVNAGIYVLEPEAVGALDPDARCDMPTLFDRLRARGSRTVVYPIHETWLDVGRPEDYGSAHQMVR
jgi:dTDP-glucose pyrophosphorylase